MSPWQWRQCRSQSSSQVRVSGQVSQPPKHPQRIPYLQGTQEKTGSQNHTTQWFKPTPKCSFHCHTKTQQYFSLWSYVSLRKKLTPLVDPPPRDFHPPQVPPLLRASHSVNCLLPADITVFGRRDRVTAHNGLGRQAAEPAEGKSQLHLKPGHF